MSPRVALLDAGTKLPIITEAETDGRGWVCVSLRGAAGWIRKVPADTMNETWFQPAMAAVPLRSAELDLNGVRYALTDADALQALSAMLVSADDLGGPMAGCPFGATLRLIPAEGEDIVLELATDSCCIYAADGRHYKYARNLWTEEYGVDNTALYSLFGVKLPY